MVSLGEVGLELQTSLQPALGLPRIAQRPIDAADDGGPDGAGGVELQSSEAPGEGLVEPSHAPEIRADVAYGRRVIRVDLGGSPGRVQVFPVFPLYVVSEPERFISLGKLRIESNRLSAYFQARVQPGLREPEAQSPLRVGVSQPRVGEREFGVQLQRLQEELDGGFVVGLAVEVVELPALQIQIVSGEVPCRALLDPLLFRRRESGFEGGGNPLGDLALDREDVLELAVVGLGPDVLVASGVDELAHDPDPIAGSPPGPSA